jgi:hypothetical protein
LPSEITFPISLVTSFPSSSFLRLMIEAALRRISPRFGAGKERHLMLDLDAALAAFSTSSGPPSAKVARTSPVVGLMVWNVSPLIDGAHWPLM